MIEIINGARIPAVPRARGKKRHLTNAIKTRPANDTIPLAALAASAHSSRRSRRKRSEFVTTETELNAIAAEASIGFRRTPKNG